MQHVIRVAMNPSQVLIIPLGLIIVAIHATKNWGDVHSQAETSKSVVNFLVRLFIVRNTVNISLRATVASQTVTNTLVDFYAFVRNYADALKPVCYRLNIHKSFIVHTVRLSLLYVLLTVHLGLILVNNQLDAQFFLRIYLFQFSTCFEHLCAHRQENQLY